MGLGMLILGHRGYSAKHPENSMIAFEEAIKAGADGVELDVWLNSEGNVVVFHDQTLKRIYGMDVKIKDIGDKFMREMRINIPHLEDVFSTLPNTSFINVEIKDIDAVEGALEIVKKYKAIDRTMFSSFNYASLRKVRRLSNDAKIGILVDSFFDFLNLPLHILWLRAEFVNIPVYIENIVSKRFLKKLIKTYKKLGVKVVLWTVNTEEQFFDYAPECDVIITDYVEKIVNAKKKYL